MERAALWNLAVGFGTGTAGFRNKRKIFVQQIRPERLEKTKAAWRDAIWRFAGTHAVVARLRQFYQDYDYRLGGHARGDVYRDGLGNFGDGIAYHDGDVGCAVAAKPGHILFVRRES